MDPLQPSSRRGASTSMTTDSSVTSHNNTDDEEDFLPAPSTQRIHSSRPSTLQNTTTTPARTTRSAPRTEPLQSLYRFLKEVNPENIVSPEDKALRAKEKKRDEEKEAVKKAERAEEERRRTGSFLDSSGAMSSRPRTGRGAASRDLNKDVDQPSESDLLQRIKETLSKAQEFSDQENETGKDIMETEGEIKSSAKAPASDAISLQTRPICPDAALTNPGLNSDRRARLDTSLRDQLKTAEKEKRAADEARDLLAMLQALVADREPTGPRNGTTGKGRNKPHARPAPVEPEVVVESPRPSPSDTRLDLLKRTNKGGQRSSSVTSSRSAAPAPRVAAEEATVAGSAADRNAHLVIDAEVIYKYPGGATEDSGVGSMGHIKKIWTERNPVIYDVQDPEPDPQTGHRKMHAAKAKDLISIPRGGAQLLTFPTGTNVVARYPDTDTFYKAEVRGFSKGKYTLMFEGEENNVTMEVDKRLVLDSKLF